MAKKKTGESHLERIARQASGLAIAKYESDGPDGAAPKSKAAEAGVVGKKKARAEKKIESLTAEVVGLRRQVHELEKGWRSANRRLRELEEAVLKLKDKAKKE